MALKIRLARGGAKKKPFYRLVLAENTAPRDGKFKEKLGTYNPLVEKSHPEHFTVVAERVKYWLSQGAKATDKVAKLLGNAGVIEKFQYKETPKKSAPSAKTLEKTREKEDKIKAQQEALKQAKEEQAAAAKNPYF